MQYNMAAYLHWKLTRLQQSSRDPLAAHTRYSQSEYHHAISTAHRLIVYEIHCLSVLGTNNTNWT
jgi:hypothetical protein